MFFKLSKSVEEYREWKLKFYNRMLDKLEVRTAAFSAAKEKLEEQIERDAVVDK